MKNWFTVIISYMGVGEDGKYKNIKQPYLIDAMTYTEAEMRATEIGGIIIPDNAEFTIEKVVKNNYQECILSDEAGDKYFKGTLRFVLDDDGKEKETKTDYIVQADNIMQALELSEVAFENMLVTYTIPSMVETPLVEVYTVEKIDELKAMKRQESLEEVDI